MHIDHQLTVLNLMLLTQLGSYFSSVRAGHKLGLILLLETFLKLLLIPLKLTFQGYTGLSPSLNMIYVLKDLSKSVAVYWLELVRRPVHSWQQNLSPLVTSSPSENP